MLSFKDYSKQIFESTELEFVTESFTLINESSGDAWGKYHELMYAKHANALATGKSPAYHKDDPRKKDAEEQEERLRKEIPKEQADKIEAKAKTSAEAMHKMITDNGHKSHGAFWTSKPGDIEKVTGIKQSQHENASDVVHRISDEKGNIRHLGASLKHLDKGSGHVPTSNPGRGQLDKALGVNTDKHMEDADRKIDAEFPQYAGLTQAKKKEAAKADKKYYDRSFELKRHAVEKVRDAHITAFNAKNHDAQVAHLRNMMHAHHTPDVPQMVVTSHGKGTRIENRADRYHPNNISHIETKPSGWNTIKHIVHFKDGSQEHWQARGKFMSGPHTSLKGSFERTK